MHKNNVPLDFTVFLKNNLRLIPLWPARYDPEEQTYVCTCWRKKDCYAPGKHPIFKNWQLTPSPTYDQETVSRIRSSKCGFAIATGPVINTQLSLIVIDVDLPGMSDPLVSQLPDTLTIRTRSGGLHFYYLLPSSLPITNISSGYIDVRAPGGFVLAPPTKGYEFLPSSPHTITHLDSLPKIPKKTKRSSHYIQSTYIPNLTHSGHIPPGERDYYVFSQLMKAADAGYTLSELLMLSSILYTHLDQPPKNFYTLAECRKKAYYVYECYSDPETVDLRMAMNTYFPSDLSIFHSKRDEILNRQTHTTIPKSS